MSLPSWLRKPSPRTVDIGLTVLVALLIVPGTIVDASHHDKALIAAIFTVAAVATACRRRSCFAPLATKQCCRWCAPGWDRQYCRNSRSRVPTSTPMIC